MSFYTWTVSSTLPQTAHLHDINEMNEKDLKLWMNLKENNKLFCKNIRVYIISYPIKMGALDAIRPPHHPRVRRPDGPPRAELLWVKKYDQSCWSNP